MLAVQPSGKARRYMEDGMVDLADSSRHPIDMHNELLCAQETIRILRREVSEKESEIAQCNAHISELNVHVEAVAQEYKHKMNSKKDEELSATKQRIVELEGITARRQREDIHVECEISTSREHGAHMGCRLTLEHLSKEPDSDHEFRRQRRAITRTHLTHKARSVPILSAVKNRYYKVTDGALRACGETTSVVFRPYNSMWSITTCFGIDFKKTKNKCINMRKKLKKRILGVEESASQQEIEKAYHKLALRLHPDTNPGNEPKRSFSSCRRLYPFLEIHRKELYMMRLTSVMTIQSSGVLPNNVQKGMIASMLVVG
uniref:J domain-containing protein n=1 Tax=Zea mays TaxID=4577 RepID=A0A804Q050_MAIZE